MSNESMHVYQALRRPQAVIMLVFSYLLLPNTWPLVSITLCDDTPIYTLWCLNLLPLGTLWQENSFLLEHDVCEHFGTYDQLKEWNFDPIKLMTSSWSYTSINYLHSLLIQQNSINCAHCYFTHCIYNPSCQLLPQHS